jgi:hypothetical protein
VAMWITAASTAATDEAPLWVLAQLRRGVQEHTSGGVVAHAAHATLIGSSVASPACRCDELLMDPSRSVRTDGAMLPWSGMDDRTRPIGVSYLPLRHASRVDWFDVVHGQRPA